MDNVEVWPDHVMINGAIPILRTDYFTRRLNALDHFYGFSPRWIIPQARMVAKNDTAREKVATQTMLVVNSLEEIRIGVGLNSWPPVILGDSDVQIAEQVAEYLGVGLGDEVVLYADLAKTFGDVGSPRAHMLATLTAGMRNVSMNFEDEVVHYKGLAFPFESLGIGSQSGPSGFNLTYAVKGTYDTPSGKFSQIYGNVVLVDCDWVVPKIMRALYQEAAAERRAGNLTEE